MQPHTVEDATTYEECIQKCILDEAGSCNRVIFRPQDQKCLIFGSIEVFLQDLEPTSSPQVNPNGQQCITGEFQVNFPRLRQNRSWAIEISKLEIKFLVTSKNESIGIRHI